MPGVSKARRATATSTILAEKTAPTNPSILLGWLPSRGPSQGIPWSRSRQPWQAEVRVTSMPCEGPQHAARATCSRCCPPCFNFNPDRKSSRGSSLVTVAFASSMRPRAQTAACAGPCGQNRAPCQDGQVGGVDACSECLDVFLVVASFASGTHTRNVWGRREWYRSESRIMVLNAGAGVIFTLAVVVGF